jgi:hypothetical protein
MGRIFNHPGASSFAEKSKLLLLGLLFFSGVVDIGERKQESDIHQNFREYYGRKSKEDINKTE